jgi:3',5'-cyclic AMP phosphodiesterase CpdA
MRLKHAFLAFVLSFGCSALGAQQARPATPAATPAAQTPRPAAAPAQPAIEVSPPRDKSAVLFAIIGDSGTGTRSQYEVGELMAKARQIFPFEFVIMLGDNIYGSERPQDFVQKFEKPYQALLEQKIPFYAALGNHDDPTQRYYKPFNMNGARFYTFKKGDARFFVLDSNYMDQPQLKWLEEQLSQSTDRWKVAYFHHPLYSSGARHGSEVDLRTRVEPLFVKYGMDVVFAGHEHFYERLQPQKGIYYFTQGGAAKLREGNIRSGPMTALGFDTDNSFMIAELGKDTMQFQVLSRRGKRVDSGTLPLMPQPKPADDKSRSQ